MIWLILGLFLWVAVHLWKRIAPNFRQMLDNKMGAGPARGVVALLLFASVILMIIGYKAAPHQPVYAPLPGMGHANNLLMVVAVILMGMGASKGKMRAWLRHPMLTGVIVWAVAHLLVNGDMSALILFGGMAIWALLQMMLINRAEGAWMRPEPGPIKGDIRLLIISAVIFSVIAGIHIWAGYNPFLGHYG